MAKQAVQYFVPDHPGSLRKAAARIQDEIDGQIVQLNSGYATDWPDYKYRVGIIRGLRLSLEALAESERENSGG